MISAMDKGWYNIELSKEEAVRFREYLIDHGIKFEPSGADTLVHFECLMSKEELELAGRWISENI